LKMTNSWHFRLFQVCMILGLLLVSTETKSVFGFQNTLPPPSGLAEDDDGPAQRVVVREKFAGWKQAHRDGSGLDDTLRANWVMLSAAGLLEAQIVATQDAEINNVLITLLNRGQVINQTRTNAEGKFSFNNLIEGTYAIVGFGPNTFFAYSLNILDYRESTADAHPSSLLIPVVQNQTTINLDWIRHYASSSQFRIYGRFVSREGTDDPAWLFGRDGLSTHGPASIPSSSVQFHPAILGPTGELAGRIHQIDELNGRPVDVRSIRVMLLDKDEVVSAVTADNFGVFRFDRVSPGQYSLVAAGADGLACIGIEAVNGGQDAQVLDVALVSPDTVGWLNHVAIETAYQRIVNRKRPSEAGENCNQFCGDLRHLYCTRNTAFRQFWDSFNQFGDQLFYGESFNYYNGQSGMGGGNGGYGYGYGGFGNGGVCNQCGGAGCNTCHPHSVDPYGLGVPSPVHQMWPSGSIESPIFPGGAIPSPAMPQIEPEIINGDTEFIPLARRPTRSR
jgi:hypothetical protein